MISKALSVTALAGLMLAGALHANAQSIRFFTTRGAQCYEVIAGSRTAGQYVRQNRGTLLGLNIVGYTDRVSRGERILTYIAGSGCANAVGLKINGTTVINIPGFPLPTVDLRRVSTDVNADNIVVFVNQGRGQIEKRVPIGTR